jgi:DNA (cytosine-5)-methyltransferase 1
VQYERGRPPLLRLHSDELIVDNFAGGGGASLGIEWALGRSPDIAINHDPLAVAMHAANHPGTRHFVEDVWDVDPVKACGGRPVALAWFSPDCKHFSKAKGGRPVSKKIRGLAWIVVRWAKALKAIGKPIRVICLENVEEFQTWGPLGEDNRPDVLRKGLTFRRWKACLEQLGYVVEFRELIAADYGAPTTRKRLFLVARCDGLPIRWPEKTHDQHGRHGLPKWRAAAECIDWELPCPSIFLTPDEAKPLKVKRPLAENTMRRIARGLQKFVIDNPNPFIVGVGGRMGQSPERPVDRPMQTITAKGDSALTVPVIAKFRGDSRGSAIDTPLPTITAGPAEKPAGAAHAMALVSAGIVPVTHQGADRNESTDEPMRTITGAHRGEKALATAYVTRLGQTGGGDQVRAAEMPLSTVTSKAEHLLTAATLVRTAHGERDSKGRKRGKGEHSVADALPTQTASPDFAIASAVLVGAGGPEYSGKPTSVEKPMGALTTENHRAIAAATLITTGYGERPGQDPRAPGLDKPLGTIVAGGGKHAAVLAFMAQHNGGFYDKRGGAGRACDQPLSAITAAGSNQNLVASFGVKLKGTCKDGQQYALPLATINAEGKHHARADAFLLKYYGADQDPRLDEPLHTITAHDRHGLVRVAGDLYQIVDIGMRMLVPRELYTAQGFPSSYRIEITYKDKPLPKDAQVRMCGNSVSPFPCAALVRAQFTDLAVEEAA